MFCVPGSIQHLVLDNALVMPQRPDVLVVPQQNFFDICTDHLQAEKSVWDSCWMANELRSLSKIDHHMKEQT